MSRWNVVAHRDLLRLQLDPEGIAELLRESLLAFARITATGVLTRGDAAILAAWDEVWGAMDATGDETIVILEDTNA